MKKIQVGVILLTAAANISCALSTKPLVQSYVEKNIARAAEKQKKFGIAYERIPDIKYDYLVKNSGEYNPVNNTIIFDPRFLTSERTAASRNDLTDAEYLINHELVHSFVQEIRNLMKIGYTKKLPDKFVDEGVADYIGRSMAGLKRKCKDMDDIDISEYKSDIFTWHVGYCTVKDVVKAHKRYGIEFMVAHPPTAEELKNPLTYRDRVMKDLSTR